MTKIMLYFTIIIFCLILLNGSASYAQNSGWTTFTSNPCKVSISHPADWSVLEKQGKFDPLGAEFKISSPGGYPLLALVGCTKLPYSSMNSSMNLTQMTDIVKDKTLSTIQSFPTGSETTVAQDTRVEPGLIGGQDAGVFTFMSKYHNPSIPNAGMEDYVLVNGDTLYTFSYFDLASTFDSPSNKQIREQMLRSIQFLN